MTRKAHQVTELGVEEAPLEHVTQTLIDDYGTTIEDGANKGGCVTLNSVGSPVLNVKQVGQVTTERRLIYMQRWVITKGCLEGFQLDSY